jgi:hypothetical protein
MSSTSAAVRVPDFFIVGHPKSGTTALFDMLRVHPQVFMPENKEPWYLAREVREAPSPRQTGWTPPTLDRYLALFAPAGQARIAGEASALYLWSQGAAGEIAELNPDAKVVAILREPASFLRSLHLQFLQVYLEKEKDFARALALEPARRERREGFDAYWPRATMYSDFVRYAEQLRRYHDLFDRERVLVLIYEDYRRDNEATLHELQRFLDIDTDVPIGVRESNPSVEARWQRLHNFVHDVSVGQGTVSRLLRRTVRAVTPAGIDRRSAVALRDRLFFSAPRQVDEQVMMDVRRRFAPEVHAISEYLDRDLVSLWGYDGLG